jgi:hypothetical protein
MSRNLTYDEWLPYTMYEKNECDIKLKDGTIILHVYPNAGFFNGCCGKDRAKVHEKDVVEIMYRKYYINDLCQNPCNQIL